MYKKIILLCLISLGSFAQPVSRATLTTNTSFGLVQRVIPTLPYLQRWMNSFYNVVDDPTTGTGSLVASNSPSLTGTVKITTLNVSGSGYLLGNTAIGTSTIAPNVNLLVSKNISGSTASYGIFNEGEIQNSVTSSAYIFQTAVTSQATVFTLPELVHYNAQLNGIGATSTITSQSAFKASSSIVGASTLNSAFRGMIPSGATNWNIYMDGSAKNYIAGSTGIGTVTPIAKLHVVGDAVISSTATVGSLIVNDGSKTVFSGSVSQVGTATTAFTVTIGSTQTNNTYETVVTPTNLLSAAAFYVSNKTTTTFVVTYIAGLTGTVTFDWILAP